MKFRQKRQHRRYCSACALLTWRLLNFPKASVSHICVLIQGFWTHIKATNNIKCALGKKLSIIKCLHCCHMSTVFVLFTASNKACRWLLVFFAQANKSPTNYLLQVTYLFRVPQQIVSSLSGPKIYGAQEIKRARSKNKDWLTLCCCFFFIRFYYLSMIKFQSNVLKAPKLAARRSSSVFSSAELEESSSLKTTTKKVNAKRITPTWRNMHATVFKDGRLATKKRKMVTAFLLGTN